MGGDRRREGTVLGVNDGHRWGHWGVVISAVRGGDAALPKLLWDFLCLLYVEMRC